MSVTFDMPDGTKCTADYFIITVLQMTENNTIVGRAYSVPDDIDIAMNMVRASQAMLMDIGKMVQGKMIAQYPDGLAPLNKDGVEQRRDGTEN